MSEEHDATDEERSLALVVDDFADGRDIACRVLESMGFRTIEASNGLDALDCARRHRPDILLLDLALPGMDGWAVARELKQDPATAGVRILGLTAHAERLPLQRAREAGCDAVLTKPCPPRELAQHVRALLEGKSQERRPRSG
jgi:CheY-like chemotaxis protein